MRKKLIIWDFDGVIADTESSAIFEYNKELKNYGVNIDIEENIKCVMGKNQVKQLESLLKYNNNLNLDIIKNINRTADKIVQKKLKFTDGVENIFKMKNFDHCIATGNSQDGIELRIYPLKIEKYIEKNNIFSADLVKNGKPEPDLFLFASEKMGYKPEDCIVIEDSINGLTAGIKANMTTIAFTKHCFYNKENYLKNIKNLGIKYIFDNMLDIKKFLENNFI